MAVVELAGDLRRRAGKGGARRVRRDGFIPAVMYGMSDPIALKVESKVFELLMRSSGGGHAVIDFKIAGEKDAVMALIREVQRDPVSREIIHVDFLRIHKDKSVHATVTIVLTGIPIGVRLQGGILDHTTREIDVKCLPLDIPSRWELDVSALEMGDSITVGELTIPKVEILTETERTLATVLAPTVVAEPTEATEEGEEAEGEEKDEDTDKENDKDKDKKGDD